MRSYPSQAPALDVPHIGRSEDSRRQGNAGMGMAIAWYASRGYTVSIPMTDTQPYDLVIDADGRLRRVWVRTTTLCGPDPGRHHILNLRTVSGLGRGLGMGKVKPFDRTTVEELFVACGDGRLFRIPSEQVAARTTLSLGPKWSRFEVGWGG